MEQGMLQGPESVSLTSKLLNLGKQLVTMIRVCFRDTWLGHHWYQHLPVLCTILAHLYFSSDKRGCLPMSIKIKLGWDSLAQHCPFL